MQIESLLDTLNRVAKILDNPSTSEISTESKVDLTKAANAINDLVRSAQEQLDNNDTVSLENLKNAADKIIIGALIYVIAADDSKYAFQAGGYYDQCKYPRFLSYIMSGIERNKPAVDLFTFIGNRALCLKDLPFTGNFAHDFGGVFNELNSVFDQKYFDNYELNTNPATTSTSDLKSQESTKKAQRKRRLEN